MEPVLLTGGCGDLGTVLAWQLGECALLLDPRAPQAPFGRHIPGSILDPQTLDAAISSADQVVHIAAWHGVHEHRGWKTPAEFMSLNVEGTERVLNACMRHNRRCIVLSSTSVDRPESVYGHTKIRTEALVRHYRTKGVECLILRPRAFIPSWNRDVYDDYIAWARWFWGGAVHILDVAQAVRLGLESRRWVDTPLVIDGGYEYTPAVLANWQGVASFDHQYPGKRALVERHGLDPSQPPQPKDIAATLAALGYQPTFSLRTLLDELEQWGTAGPPPPWTTDSPWRRLHNAPR